MQFVLFIYQGKYVCIELTGRDQVQKGGELRTPLKCVVTEELQRVERAWRQGADGVGNEVDRRVHDQVFAAVEQALAAYDGTHWPARPA